MSKDRFDSFDYTKTLLALDSLATRLCDKRTTCTTDKERDNDNRSPDSDAIKMFVGQIPKEWTESDCHQLLDEFGEIYSIRILRDKKSLMSRGCCFVTYFTRRSALDAQSALHNIRRLPGMHHPIQMKPSDSESRNERKLFVGMLSKKYTDTDVKQLFSTFGTIEECTILRDTNGHSKGCAFVTYSTRANALNAIKAMNHSQTLEGCSSPVVVKFADTQKDKDARKQQQLFAQQLWSAVTSPSITPALTTNPYLALAAVAASAAQQQQLAAAAATLAIQQQLAVSNSDPLTLTAAALASNPALTAAFCSSSSGGSTNHSPGLTSNSLNGANGIYTIQQPFLGSRTSGLSSTDALITGSTLSPVNSTNTKQVEGPEGSNLFIYHLPAEYTDTDLAQTFASFGNVVSSKVFIDKVTNLSKCFGFVSFDNPLSAQAAIQAMNGFQIGNKRLKVQLKRTKEKPY